MSVPQIGQASGTCSRCGRTYFARRPAREVVCECSKICERCGGKMSPVTDLPDPRTYGKVENVHGQRVTLETTGKCDDCGWLTEDKPVEVRLE